MTALLFFSLFLPRISLFIAWLAGGIPFNNVPILFDILSAVFFPRILIIYYIVYADLGVGWLIAHIIALIIKLIINGISSE